MPSSKEYLDYVLDLFSRAEGILYRPMMGEYILYCGGKVIGGVYDDRLLVKPTPSALALLPNARRELPYEGAKEMLLVEEEDRELLGKVAQAIKGDLPAPKKR